MSGETTGGHEPASQAVPAPVPPPAFAAESGGEMGALIVTVTEPDKPVRKFLAVQGPEPTQVPLPVEE